MLNYNSSIEISEFVKDNSPDPIENYIRSFRELPMGWNFGEGTAPSDEIIESALNVYRIGKSFGLIGNAFPVGEGEIEISLLNQDHFIDILIKRQNTFEYTYEIGLGDQYNEVEHNENISLEELITKLGALREIALCDSLEYSMQEGLIGIREDYRVVALEKSEMGSPSLIETVWPIIMAPQYAATKGHSIQLSQENQLYIGHSIQQSSEGKLA